MESDILFLTIMISYDTLTNSVYDRKRDAVIRKQEVRLVGVLKVILTILFVIDCIGLTAAVLLQEGKSTGLGALAGAAESYWGKNKGRTMEGGLVKLTTIMGVLFFVFSLVLNMLP